LVFFVFLIAYFFYALEPTFALNEPVLLNIEKGESFRNISAELSQQKLIRSIFVFKLYSYLTGTATKIQPGYYKLATTMSVPEIVGTLINGGGNEIVVKIIEGATLKDIDNILASSSVIKKGDLVDFNFKKLGERYSFLNEVDSLEGFLYPDTYNFYIKSDVESIVRKMLDNFELKIWPLISSYSDWYDKLILASYLEKEVKTFEERRKVADILLKRLKNKLSLDVDATLVYFKCNKEFLFCDNLILTNKDKENKHPYNTYLNIGLTPTPITNPTAQSVKAILDPEKTPYLYYCNPTTSVTIFSKNLKEHNQSCFDFKK